MPIHKVSDIELSIVLPCLDEQRTVGACVKKALAAIAASGIHGEVVVADNGSTDESKRIAKATGARVIDVSSKGYGSALDGGIRAARGHYIIMADSDASYNFTHVPRFLERLREGYDLVMGNRFLGGISAGAMPFSHRIGNPVLSGLGRIFFRTPIGDFHCGIRGFSATAYRRMKLQTHGMEFASEMIVKATLLGMRITEVATTLNKDGRDHAPHLKTWRDGWRHLRFMMLFCPRWVLLYPGLATLAAGIGLTVWTLFQPSAHALTSMSALGMVVVGMETVSFWNVSQAFAFGAGLHPHDPAARALRSLSRIETSLLLGCALILVGLSGIVFSLFSPLRAASLGVSSLTLVLFGTQFILSSFLIGIIRIQRKADSI